MGALDGAVTWFGGRFAVTPFSEKCGLIEWVNNTNGIRQLVTKVYKNTGHVDLQTNKIIKDMYDAHERKVSLDALLAG